MASQGADPKTTDSKGNNKSPLSSRSRSRSRSSRSRSRSRSRSSRSYSRSSSRSRSSRSSRSRSRNRRRSRSRSRSASPAKRAKLFVGGLTRTVNKDHLEEMFGTFGKVKSAEVAFMPRTTISKGFGYVEFYNRDDALRAIDYMHGAQIDGKVAKVEFSSVPVERRRRSPPRGSGRQQFRGRGGRGGPPPRRRWSPPRGGRYGRSRSRSRSPIRRGLKRSRSPRRSRSRSRSRSVKRRRFSRSPSRSRSRSRSKGSRSRSRSRSKSN